MNSNVSRDKWIRTLAPPMTRPSLRDNTADSERLIKGIKKTLDNAETVLEFSLIGRLPFLLRRYGYDVRAVLWEAQGTWHVIDLFANSENLTIYGLAADLGTTSVALRLVDLENGAELAETTFLNPQVEFGEDILARIQFASTEEGLETLRKTLMGEINRAIHRLIVNRGISADAVVGMSVAGNTTMTHFFLGLNPYWICREPYIPVVNKPGILSAEELGINIHPRAPVLVFPNVGSYLGGDLIAGILASGMTHRDGISLLIDVGTNAEVVLGNREWIMGCAGAAGPALEGGVAKMGMMAGPGAIERVMIDPASGDLTVKTIGGGRPVGICGSGLIDLTAQLYLAGMVDLRGKFVAERCGDRLEEIEGIPHYVVVSSRDSGTGKDLTLSQTDIDSLVRSKAAMYTILTTITRMVHVSFEQIERVMIAGTFGNYIDPRSAMTIGMIPDLPLEKYRSMGNTCLDGATSALLSRKSRDEMDRVRDRITYVEMNVNQEFMNLFSASKFIPHTDTSLFPSIKGRVRGIT